MESLKGQTINTKKEFNLKDTMIGFCSLTFICMAVIFIFVVYDVFTIQLFLSFINPSRMTIYIVIASFSLLLLGVIFTLYTPSKYIDETNMSFQNYSVLHIFSFMFFGVLFEELLFRGIIQNLIFYFTDSQWTAIIITAFLFVCFHTRYFKKPVMLLNITVPSLIFGWLYFETNNILVPFAVHFIMNLGMTLFFKYNLLKVRT